ncbi:MAG: DUF1569 domain-containing protein [Bacteroidota bacterium]
MKKNLLHKGATEKLISRIQNLTPQSMPQWGSMAPTEMLLHCNKVNEYLLTAQPQKKPTSIKQYFTRWVVLYIMPGYPKGAQAPKKVITKGLADPLDFEKEKQNFIEIIHRFPNHGLPLTLHHPYFGGLTTKQWGLAAWKHVDHHLRQFGV